MVAAISDKEQTMKTLARAMGIVACVAAVLSGTVAGAGTAPGFFFADGFDRPDSTDMGSFWTEQGKQEGVSTGLLPRGWGAQVTNGFQQEGER